MHNGCRNLCVCRSARLYFFVVVALIRNSWAYTCASWLLARTCHRSLLDKCDQFSNISNNIKHFAPRSVNMTALTVLYKFGSEYTKNTPKKLKIIDAYLLYVFLTGVIQFVYCCLVGTFPFNSFLSGFISCVSCFILGGNYNDIRYVIYIHYLYVHYFAFPGGYDSPSSTFNKCMVPFYVFKYRWCAPFFISHRFIYCAIRASFNTPKFNNTYKVKLSFSPHVPHRLGYLMALHFCFSVCLRLQVNPQNRSQFHGISPERGFADFIFAHIILHIVIMNFIG